ncbi:MAG: glycoside hydrolase [Frankiales bacterium]|nr:glycoside hydrolase [Frankiales bacterium]
MLSPRHSLVTARLRAVTVLLALVSSFVLLGTSSPAEAATAFQKRVVTEASHHSGAPYRYGSSGPTRFDCSGFTLYVFSRFGKRLPHSSAAQYNAVHHVAKSQMAPGDLIFFRNSSGQISHVAIYAGAGKMWHAPHSGTVVKLAPIYSSNYVVGRV